MCGIIGYIGLKESVPILISGLERLEYRGYDSAGVACLNHHQGELFVVKEKGKLSALKKQLEGIRLASNIGIGHTRWATHGEPSRANAHPHTDSRGQIALVHNGIVENYAALKKELLKKGFSFKSATDTEVAANLIGHYYRKGHLLDAVRQAVRKLRGFFALVAISKDEPDRLVVFKRSNPLVIGLGEGENFVASDVSALLPYTHRVVFLNDDEYAQITRNRVDIFSLFSGKKIKRSPTRIHWNIAQARKAGYPHFMLKEIYEQPTVLAETVSKRLETNGRIEFDAISSKDRERLKKIKKIFFVSCGTAYHAGLVGMTMAEDLAGIPAEARVSSEFRYGNPALGPSDMVVLITQSGETADTLAALREAKAKRAFTLAIVNVVGSTIAREANAVIYTHAGPEIGVASTKAYTAQLLTLAFFTLYFAGLRKKIARKRYQASISELKKIEGYCEQVLKQAKRYERCARKYYRHGNFLYLGRSYNFPTALEGALKLKEISYAHAHGYAAGEMKHGPIALIDRHQPVICIAPASKTYDKMISNIEEIRARKGIVIAIGTQGDKTLEGLADHFFPIPKTEELLSPILSVVSLQLLAYKIAVFNGRDVDQPRNLAKSVTVE